MPLVYLVGSQRTVRVGVLAAQQGWCGPFSRRVFEMNFVEARPIGGEGNPEAALADLGKDVEATIRRAHEPDIEEALVRDANWALDNGLFGSPHFIVGDELFWGDDRLEDAVERALHGRLSPDAAL